VAGWLSVQATNMNFSQKCEDNFCPYIEKNQRSCPDKIVGADDTHQTHNYHK
jgi:hypothetical protein